MMELDQLSWLVIQPRMKLDWPPDQPDAPGMEPDWLDDQSNSPRMEPDWPIHQLMMDWGKYYDNILEVEAFPKEKNPRPYEDKGENNDHLHITYKEIWQFYSSYQP